MRREPKRLMTCLGRVDRDVGRKIAGDRAQQAGFAPLLGLVERLLAEQSKDQLKLDSRHAPEVVCIAKGKAHKRYESGCKLAIAATNGEGHFLADKAFEGDPYDGHNPRLILKKFRCNSARILETLQEIMANPDAWTSFPGIQNQSLRRFLGRTQEVSFDRRDRLVNVFVLWAVQHQNLMPLPLAHCNREGSEAVGLQIHKGALASHANDTIVLESRSCGAA
jgi:hypothetical protein